MPFPVENILPESQVHSVNRAFSRQSGGYDEADARNPVLQDMRTQVYNHVARYLKPNGHILELNAGTGIDALHFVSQGHKVHAIDLSDGMIEQIKTKIIKHRLTALTCQQLSYVNLHELRPAKFDFVFSNFGGLNCVHDLSLVARHLPGLLSENGYVTWVIMPPVCAWELLAFLRGNIRHAFRRFKKGGVRAHLEGAYFQTYYHSLHDIRIALGPSFKLVECEGLAALTPQPHRGDFPVSHPKLYSWLKRADILVRNHFPFNRWADHIIVTFQYTP